MSETISLEAVLKLVDQGYKSGMEAAKKAQEELAQETEKTSKSITGQMTAANLASKVITAAFQAITGAIGDAVKRIDTLNNYPKVMESLGYSAADAQKSINTLSEGIDGLPTTLDSIVSSAQRLTASLGDIGEGTKTAVALNDLFLAGGGGAEAAARGLEQYNQMLAAGKVDMQSWKTLLEVAPGQMQQLAQAMIGATANQKDLYNALQDGTITMEDLNAAVVKLDKEGGEGFASFAEQARAATGGIGTAWKNIQTAVTKGVAKVIDEFDKGIKAAGGDGIASALNGLKTVITGIFNAIATVAGFLGKHLKTILTIVLTIVAAVVASKIVANIDKIKAGLSGLVSGFTNVSGSVQTFNAVLKANPIGAVITLITTLITVINVLGTALESEASKAFRSFVDSSKSAIDASKQMREEAQNNIGTAEAEGAAASALASEVEALAAKENKSAEEKATLKAKVAQLNASVEDLNLAYNEETDQLNMSTELLKKKAKAYADQAKAKAIEEALNDSLKERIDIERQLAEANERMGKYSDEQKELLEGQGKAYAFLNNIIPNVGGGVGNLADQYLTLKDTLEGLDGEYDALTEIINEYSEQVAAAEEEATRKQLEEEEKRKAAEQKSLETRQQVLENFVALQQGALDRALENGTATMEMLSEKNQETATRLQETWSKYKDAATNIFDALSGESELSVDKMIENLQKNQQVISEMGNNMAGLRDRFASLGLDEAILDQLQELGPQAAGEIANLASASDEKLQEVAGLYAQGGTLAYDSYTQGLGAAADASAEKVRSVVMQTEESLREAVANANWNELGEAPVQGFAEGLGLDGPAIDAAAKIGSDSISATEGELETGSPSRVYQSLGKDVVTGFANGISALSTRPVTIMRTIISNVIQVVRGQVGMFEVLGRNAGNGFANGLEATRSRVISVAQSIATSVTQTIQKALNEHSPSKVLEKLGLYAGEGFAIGLARTKAMVAKVSGSIANTVSDAVGGSFGPSFSAAYAGGGSMEIQSLRAEIKDLKNAILSQPIEVTSSFDVNGREMAKGTATYMRDELNRQSTLTNNLGGNR